MYAEVILNRRVPGRFESFTYSVPESMRLEPGQIVHVPFRNLKLAAIVRQLHGKKPAYRTREILEATEITLPDCQMELADWMAERYGCGFSKAMELFVPEKIWRGKIDATKTAEERTTEITIPKAIETIAAKALTNNDTRLILEKTALPKVEFFAALLKKLPKENQALFLFPEIFSLQAMEPHFPIYHSGLNEKKKAELWSTAKNGSLQAIAGTRAALFLPFAKLGLIVLDMEENENYREKRQPSYHALEVAEKIAAMKKIPLILTSGAPRTETLYAAKSLTFTDKNPEPEISILDMADERRKGAAGVFGLKTLELIATAMASTKQVLLFVNRRGEASALLCSDCETIIRCKSCNSPLTLHASQPASQALQCHRCRTAAEAPELCPQCSGTSLKKLGVGTEKLEQEIQKLFGRAKTFRLDSETAKKPLHKTWKETAAKMHDADILIATKIIEKPLSLPRLNVIATIGTDSLLQFQDFRATEKLFQLLIHLKQLLPSQRTNTSSHFLIQTMLPDHRLYQTFAQNNLEEFYGEELNTRKLLSLPPFGITKG